MPDPLSLLAAFVWLMAAGMYPLGFLFGVCSTCCDSTDPDNPCDIDRIRVTLNGLPTDCARSANTPGAQYQLREYSDWNGCSFHVFRIYTAATQCRFRAELPLGGNQRFFCDSGSIRVTIDFVNDRLYLYLGYLQATAILKPAAGETFRQLPYDAGVIVESEPLVNGVTTCEAAKWAAVTLKLDTGVTLFKPLECPDGRLSATGGTDYNPSHSTACTAPADLSPAASATGRPYSFSSCDTCDSRLFQAYALPSPDPNVWPGHDELNVRVTLGNISLNKSFHPDMPTSIPGYASMSGTYALKYHATAHAFAAPVTIENEDFTAVSAPTDAGCGWAGTFFSQPYGADGMNPNANPPLDQPGYIWSAIDENLLTRIYMRWSAAMQIAVVPTGWHYPYDMPARVFRENPCQQLENAFEVRLQLWHSASPDSGSGYYKALSYWDTFSTFYSSVPCQQRKCRGAPSFSVTQTVYHLRVPVRYSGTSRLTVSGSYSVTIESV